MLTKNDILEQLRQGQTVDELADQLTEALNSANDEYQEELKTQENERIVDAAKRQATVDMLDALCDYCVACGADNLIEAIHETDVEVFEDYLERIINIAKEIKVVDTPRGNKMFDMWKFLF
jgi:predicted RNA-binding protein Jag